jgi:hypothetical protein
LSGFCLAIAEKGAGEDCVLTEEQCTAALVDCGCSTGVDYSNVGYGRRTKLNKLCEQMHSAPGLGDACPTKKGCPEKEICRADIEASGSQDVLCSTIAALYDCATTSEQCADVLTNCNCGAENVDCTSVKY